MVRPRMRFGAYSAVYEKHKRLLGAQSDTGEEPERQQPAEAGIEADARDRRQGSDDRRNAEQQQVELVDRLAAESVGELALAERADKEAEQRDAADPRHLRPGDEAAFEQVGHQRAENREIEDVAEIARSDQRQDAPMERPHRGVVHLLADIGFDRLR